MINLTGIIEAILDGYTLHPLGLHGIDHWGRVFLNGTLLAEKTGADIEVVHLFALFHDARRENEGHDPEHGLRGARLAEKLHGRLFRLKEKQLKKLTFACRWHTQRKDFDDITIQTCWDADRLDLFRVGITPLPERLCTATAKHHKTIQAACDRVGSGYIPEQFERIYAHIKETKARWD